MREYKTTLGEREVVLKASFAASLRISKEVADPLFILREAVLDQQLLSAGITSRSPNWTFTIENIPLIFRIGMEAAGDKTPLSEIQELVFDEGFIQAREKASEYLSLIVGPSPEESLEDMAKEGDDSGE